MHNVDRVLILLFALVLDLAASGIAASADWPPNYIVKENSESPDGRYAVLVQSQDAALAEDENESAVYLADTKAHATLGEIGKVDYFNIKITGVWKSFGLRIPAFAWSRTTDAMVPIRSRSWK